MILFNDCCKIIINFTTVIKQNVFSYPVLQKDLYKISFKKKLKDLEDVWHVYTSEQNALYFLKVIVETLQIFIDCISMHNKTYKMFTFFIRVILLKT